MLENFIPLRCTASTLEQLATSLVGYSLANAGTDWLVTSAFLETLAGVFMVSAAIEVLNDGAVVRPLHIASAQDMLLDIEEALPDIQRRAETRGFTQQLPDVPDTMPTTPEAVPWFEHAYSTEVVIRGVERHGTVHPVACGLLFRHDGDDRLLIGTDLTTIALVVSDDPPLIDSYLEDCDTAGLNRYAALTA